MTTAALSVELQVSQTVYQMDLKWESILAEQMVVVKERWMVRLMAFY